METEMIPAAASRPGGRRYADVLEALGALWLLIVTVIFLWQAVTYRGIVALLAELQFDWAGRYYPTLTCASLIGLCSIPGMIALRVANRRRERLAETSTPPRRGGEIIRALTGIAAGFLITAIGTVVLTLRLPSEQGAPRILHADVAPPADLANGPAVLTGQIDYLRPAALEEDVWLSRRNSIFAPMGAVGDRPTVRFFVELDPGQHADPANPIEARRGVLKRNALPGELVRLYRYAGLTVPQPYWVLYDDRATLRWPYLAVAAELALVAMVLALAAVVLRSLDRRSATDHAEPGR